MAIVRLYRRRGQRRSCLQGFKRLIMITSIAVIASACGPSPLSNIGDASDRWVHGGSRRPATTVTASVPTTTTTMVAAVMTDLDAVEWTNDDLGAPKPGEDVVGRVFDRSSGYDRFVQASRAEIAAALPGIMVPRKVPRDVEFVTSQLVFSTTTKQLDRREVAAFGFWVTEPYSVPRTKGQRAVMIVHPATRLADPAELCDVAEPEETCSITESASGPPVALIEGEDGWRALLQREPYRYELVVRGQRARGDLDTMMHSLVPLDDRRVATESGRSSRHD